MRALAAAAAAAALALALAAPAHSQTDRRSRPSRRSRRRRSPRRRRSRRPRPTRRRSRPCATRRSTRPRSARTRTSTGRSGSSRRASDQVLQVVVDDESGEIEEAWTGEQISWKMARGYPGAFGRMINAPYIWLPLCLAFLLILFDFRRPFRIAHLDLLVIVAGLRHLALLLQPGEDRAVGAARLPGAPLPAGPNAVARLPRRRRAEAVDPDDRGRDHRRRPPGLPRRPERRRLERDRRRLRGGDRRRQDLGRLARSTETSPTTTAAETPTARSPTTPTSRSSRSSRGRESGTTSPRPTPRRSSSTWPRRPCSSGSACACARARAASAWEPCWPRDGQHAHTRPSHWNRTQTTPSSRCCWWRPCSFLTSPPARGALLALATLTKFAPAALVPLFMTYDRPLTERVARRRAPHPVPAPDVGGTAVTGPVRRVLRVWGPFIGAFAATTAVVMAQTLLDPGLSHLLGPHDRKPSRPRHPVQRLGPGRPRPAPHDRQGVRHRASRSSSRSARAPAAR